MIGLEPTSEHIACLEDRNEKLLESNCCAAFIISICDESVSPTTIVFPTPSSVGYPSIKSSSFKYQFIGLRQLQYTARPSDMPATERMRSERDEAWPKACSSGVLCKGDW